MKRIEARIVVFQRKVEAMHHLAGLLSEQAEALDEEILRFKQDLGLSPQPALGIDGGAFEEINDAGARESAEAAAARRGDALEQVAAAVEAGAAVDRPLSERAWKLAGEPLIRQLGRIDELVRRRGVTLTELAAATGVAHDKLTGADDSGISAGEWTVILVWDHNGISRDDLGAA